MYHLIIRSPPSASPNQSPYNTFLSGNQLRLAASSVAYQRQPSSGCESRCHLSSLVNPLFELNVYFQFLPTFKSIQKIQPALLSSRLVPVQKDLFFFIVAVWGRTGPSIIKPQRKAAGVRFFAHLVACLCVGSPVLLGSEYSKRRLVPAEWSHRTCRTSLQNWQGALR